MEIFKDISIRIIKGRQLFNVPMQNTCGYVEFRLSGVPEIKKRLQE
jgi:hypothetical protein